MIIVADGEAACDRRECSVVDAASSALKVLGVFPAAAVIVAHVEPGELAAAEGLVGLRLP